MYREANLNRAEKEAKLARDRWLCSGVNLRTSTRNLSASDKSSKPDVPAVTLDDADERKLAILAYGQGERDGALHRREHACDRANDVLCAAPSMPFASSSNAPISYSGVFCRLLAERGHGPTLLVDTNLLLGPLEQQHELKKRVLLTI